MSFLGTLKHKHGNNHLLETAVECRDVSESDKAAYRHACSSLT
uniref:Uncharacterized protein n=1 Tax=Arundo donax TaxID=35708 RepID=A0A0A9HUK7_ARUDO